MQRLYLIVIGEYWPDPRRRMPLGTLHRNVLTSSANIGQVNGGARAAPRSSPRRLLRRRWPRRRPNSMPATPLEP